MPITATHTHMTTITLPDSQLIRVTTEKFPPYSSRTTDLTPDEARQLARALDKAADACDALTPPLHPDTLAE